jgi:hypothetical protein
MADRSGAILGCLSIKRQSFLQLVGSSDPLSARKLHESYKKATDRRIFVSPSTMAKSIGTLSKSFEISDKLLWIQRKNRIPLSPPVFYPHKHWLITNGTLNLC